MKVTLSIKNYEIIDIVLMFFYIHVGGGSVISELQHIIKNPDVADIIDAQTVGLAAPIVPRRNVFCVGKNYMDHVQEVANTMLQKEGSEEPVAAVPVPKYPQFFSKVPETLIGCSEFIPTHRTVTNWLDYEVELAVVIGKKGRDISVKMAEDHIFGYSIANDVSARDIQKRHVQFMKGKCLDGTCPMGPYILLKDSVQGNIHDARIRCWVNGRLRQDSRTSNMIYDVKEIIHQLSKGMTLYPGDVILTGTPAGVGFAMDPPEVLRSGDHIRMEIDELGILENSVFDREGDD
jgi:2-keto-4-pentenoate hydratase/2-oxohepta-3-ene-1,7-dioic acid hydratase in catechol pathway